MKKPVIILIGNEKGGAGKTTTCMHIIAYLLEKGAQVGTIDLDSRQLSLTTFLRNRARQYPKLLTPRHFVMHKPELDSAKEAEKWYEDNINVTINKMKDDRDFIIIDTAAGDDMMSFITHSYADIIITPMNDSLVDLQLIMECKDDTYSPGIYSQMIWNQRIKRHKRDKGTIQWVVLKNRSSNLKSKNKQNLDKVLKIASSRLGFKLINGLSDRAIYKELFNNGLTLLDLPQDNYKMNGSHVIAKHEIRSVFSSISEFFVTEKNHEIS